MRRFLPAFLVVALFAPPAIAQVAIVNPRVTTDSSIDCSSAAEVVRQITKPGMTDEQKAVACWRFMLDHFYHWFPPYEDSSPEPVRDFAKAINSYGFSPCFGNAPVLTDLWEACGLKTRSWTITGHSIPEVYYGGAWHMLDADARGFGRKADGQIASVEELAADPKLLTDPPGGKSDPYYPFGAPDFSCAPLIPWGRPATMVSLYTSRRDNYRYNKRAVAGHPMFLDLRPGETLTLNYANEGKWFHFDKLPKDMTWKNAAVADGPVVETRLDKGPASYDNKLTYGNGTLNWEPPINATRAEDLLWSGSNNVKLVSDASLSPTGRLSPIDPNKPLVAVFRVSCPWVLVEANFGFTGPFAAGELKVEVSTDGGHAWAEPKLQPGPTSHQGAEVFNYPLTEQVAGKYEYLIRVTCAGSLAGIHFENTFQVAQLSLPRLHPGKNVVTVSRGPDEGVVQLLLRGDKAAKERYIVESSGLNVNKSLTAEKRDVPATVVYKLTAPADLKAISMGGQLSTSRGELPMIAGEYSFDGGKTWTQAFKLEKNENPQNTQFEEDVRADVPAGVKTREALFRYTIRGDSEHKPGKQAATIEAIRLYGYYALPQPEGAKLKVDVAWTETAGGKSADKSHSLVADKFPASFDLTCGGDAVQLESITMTPVK